MRWLSRSTRHSPSEPDPLPIGGEPLSLQDTLLALPRLLDSSSLPNGVVELLVEDPEASIRQLLDIHDGRVTLVEPGKCIPWASIAGPTIAWAMALGPERNATALRLAGDEPLALRVLAALPRCD
jgi:hypothetical protein